MRYFVAIDDEHFALYEQKTEERQCPTCGQTMIGTFPGRLMVVRGVRDEEDGWVVVKEQALDYMPIGPERAQEQALKFALAS